MKVEIVPRITHTKTSRTNRPKSVCELISSAIILRKMVKEAMIRNMIPLKKSNLI
jgi:hypothetical protein